MKVTRFAAICLAVVAITTVIAWFLRDTIIERISSPILEEYGVAVTGVSLDALATDNAYIGYLELELENGTAIVIRNLTLPIRRSPAGVRTFTAERISIHLPAMADDEPLALASLLEQILLLPVAVPNTEAIVAELVVAPYPAMRQLRWATAEADQALSASIDTNTISAEINKANEQSYDVLLSIRGTFESFPDQTITGRIGRSDKEIAVTGVSELDLAVSALLADTDVASSGVIDLMFDIEIPYDEQREASVSALIVPLTPIRIEFNNGTVDAASVSAGSASPMTLDATYPELQWMINGDQAALRLSYEQWADIPVLISGLSCRSGPACSMNIETVMDPADLAWTKARRIELAAAQDIVFAKDAIRVNVHPDARLSMTGISANGLDLAKLNARLLSAADMTLSGIAWRFAADSIEGNIDSIRLDEKIAFSTTVSLSDVVVGESNQRLSGRAAIVSPSSQATWDDLMVFLPGFDGNVTLQNELVTAAFTTVGLDDGQEAGIKARHNIDSGSGQLNVGDVVLSFRTKRLSDRAAPWPFKWDISAGSVTGGLRLAWRAADAGWQLVGESSIQISGLAGRYDDIVFTGLSTSLEPDYRTASGFDVEPSTISVDFVDVGMPLEDIEATYILHPDELSIDVEELNMTAFGGVIRTDPFTYYLGRDSNSIFLRAESIELSQLLSLEHQEALEFSGSAGAEIPVTIAGDAVTVAAGRLTGEPPGGVVRFKQDVVPDDMEVSSIGLATEALSNLEYESLTSVVDYDKDGNLKLQMRVPGRNPDMEGSPPVILSLGLENNVPQMLRTLRLTRTVEEILEQRLSR